MPLKSLLRTPLLIRRAEGAAAAKAATEGRASAGGSVTVDAAKGAVVFNRYYHVFVKGELDELVQGVAEVGRMGDGKGGEEAHLRLVSERSRHCCGLNRQRFWSAFCLGSSLLGKIYEGQPSASAPL